MPKKSQLLEDSGYVIINQVDFIALCTNFAIAIKLAAPVATLAEIEELIIPFDKIAEEMQAK